MELSRLNVSSALCWLGTFSLTWPIYSVPPQHCVVFKQAIEMRWRKMHLTRHLLYFIHIDAPPPSKITLDISITSRQLYRQVNTNPVLPPMSKKRKDRSSWSCEVTWQPLVQQFNFKADTHTPTHTFHSDIWMSDIIPFLFTAQANSIN